MKRTLATLTSLLLIMTVGATAMESIDITALQARLEAQEARLADLQAKAAAQNGGTPSAITSLRKNAAVSIGGLVTTGYYASLGSIRQYDENTGKMNKTEDVKIGDFYVSDAELRFNVDVNEHFDAHVLMNLHNVGDSSRNNYAVAKEYWIRWKNIRDTGFGLVVGRRRAVFGHTGNQEGYLDSMVCGAGGDGHAFYLDDTKWAEEHSYTAYNGWKFNGATQITPYWESRDGKLLAEVSFMQSIWNDTGALRSGSVPAALSTSDRNGVRRTRSRNYGPGSMSARVAYTPIEGLTFTASAINFRANGAIDSGLDMQVRHARNNTAAALSFSWRPTFLKQARIWSQWVRGWNINNWDGAKSDVLNYGASWDFNDRFTVFAQGDYLKARYKDIELPNDNPRDTGWAAYVGAIYSLPYGVAIEAGWRHDRLTERYEGRVQSKIRTNTYYANIGFSF